MRLAAAAVLALPLLLASCSSAEGESGSESEADRAAEEQLGEVADQSTCADEATPVTTPYDAPFPEDWTFPPDTVVYSVEDRAGVGTIATGVSTADFDDVLAYLNADAVDAGFAITSGETEENDAEASWESADFSGRWSIRKSGECPGEIVVQVLAAPGG